MSVHVSTYVLLGCVQCTLKIEDNCKICPISNMSYLYSTLEEEMATHSSVLDWRIPWTEEPGGLQSMGSQGVGHH